jgi:glutathione S-transferase
MGLHPSDHPDVPRMKGLHLFHFTVSNCSQRVRLALEEKGLDWTSHHLNLPANEHVTEDYQRINPNGVVPTLVHDGQVVIESNDILVYLDEHFPDPPLRPAEPEARSRMDESIALSSAFQPTIKVLSHERIFRPYRKVDAATVELFEAKHRDPSLAACLRDYAENGAAWRERVARADAHFESTLDRLEAALAVAPYLSGERYGLADISWAVNANRLVQAGIDLARWPRFADWAGRVTARPAFDTAVASYAPS